jgi:hypothetical protein
MRADSLSCFIKCSLARDSFVLNDPLLSDFSAFELEFDLILVAAGSLSAVSQERNEVTCKNIYQLPREWIALSERHLIINPRYVQRRLMARLWKYKEVADNVQPTEKAASLL